MVNNQVVLVYPEELLQVLLELGVVESVISDLLRGLLRLMLLVLQPEEPPQVLLVLGVPIQQLLGDGLLSLRHVGSVHVRLRLFHVRVQDVRLAQVVRVRVDLLP